MALDQSNLAGNLRRLAGMHLITMEQLARHVGISRQGLQAIVAQTPAQRAIPRGGTAIKLAQAFGITLDALYEDPGVCLREAVNAFDRAPIASSFEKRLPLRGQPSDSSRS